MKVLILTGGFHPEMPLAEARNLGVEVEEEESNMVVGEIDDWKRLKRLGYSHLVLQYLGKIGIDDELPFDAEEQIQGSFAARFKKVNFSGDFFGVKKKVLEKLNPYIEGVDLDNPDTTLYFLLSGENIYCGRLLHEFDASEFKERESESRPFSRPVSLPPREARCWVNLTGIEKDERLLDPFCGTGGIIIEGGLMGCEVYGSDSEGKMVSGCRRNMNHYDVDGEIRKCEVQKLSKVWDKKFDAVVTDPPYGRASKVSGKELKELYGDALDQIHEILVERGKCVIGAPRRLNIEDLVENSRFKQRKKFKEKVHGDLTREVFVLEKI